MSTEPKTDWADELSKSFRTKNVIITHASDGHPDVEMEGVDFAAWLRAHCVPRENDELKKELAEALDALEKCRDALDLAKYYNLQFWLEYARGDGEPNVGMPSAAHTTFHIRKNVQIGIDAATELLRKHGRLQG
jgi:hypothetical protein